MKSLLHHKTKKVVIPLATIFLLLFSFTYYELLQTGKKVVEKRTIQVNTMVADSPTFFTSIFNEIFPQALECEGSTPACTQATRSMFDTLPPIGATQNLYAETRPSTTQPMYFIRLLPSGKIAKLFFSGNLKIEPINTRGEKLVKELLEGKRTSLYGPYFNAEVFIEMDSYGNVISDNRTFKPAYLKDLYSQVEVIVPYYHDNKIVGAVVYLHGE